MSVPTPKKKKPYLYEVDLMRVIFIFGVLANHTTSAITTPMSTDSTPYIIMLATHLILHFTRMGFMFVSGLVLFMQYYNRPGNTWPSFWFKRYKGSGVPYVIWTAFYTFFVAWFASTPLTSKAYFTELWDHLLHADGFYMYYLLVMFQLYLIFPILVWMFKKLDSLRNHLLLLGISAAIQFAFVWYAKYTFPNVSHAGWPYMFANYGNFILAYQFYFLAGAFTSIHYQTVIDFLHKHRRALYGTTFVLALGTFGLYYYNTYILKLTRHYVELIHQPYLMVYASFMVASVFMLCLEYAKRRENPGWRHFAQFVSVSSKISFGVYLSQTIGLTILTKMLTYTHLSDWQYLALLPVAYVGTLGFTWLLCYFFYKVPPFGVLIGRPQQFFSKFTSKKEVSTK